MQKARVVIEFNVIEYDYVLDNNSVSQNQSEGHLVDILARPSRVNMLHEQALLNALRADPHSHIEFIKNSILASLETLDINRQIASLAKSEYSYLSNLAILTTLFSRLKEDSKIHFQQAIREGWFAEGTDLIFSTVQVHPISIKIE